MSLGCSRREKNRLLGHRGLSGEGRCKDKERKERKIDDEFGKFQEGKEG